MHTFLVYLFWSYSFIKNEKHISSKFAIGWPLSFQQLRATDHFCIHHLNRTFIILLGRQGWSGPRIHYDKSTRGAENQGPGSSHGHSRHDWFIHSPWVVSNVCDPIQFGQCSMWIIRRDFDTCTITFLWNCSILIGFGANRRFSRSFLQTGNQLSRADSWSAEMSQENDDSAPVFIKMEDF